MHKLAEVEQARAMMNEAKDWSIWRWLMEKRRVRTTADIATAALDELEKKVKAGWSEDLKKAYQELVAEEAAKANARSRQKYEKAREEAQHIDPRIKQAIEKVKEADDVATAARNNAEDTFVEAEKRLSAGMAREGAQKAIEAWDVREKAIRKAESTGRTKWE
jgi:hypothetical protein